MAQRKDYRSPNDPKGTKYKRRWGDVNYQWGPFTWSPERRGHGFGVMLDSGDDEHPGCHVRFYLSRATLLIELPSIVQPWRKKVYVRDWPAETIARLGRDWYYDEHPREYGFNFTENTLHIHYGAQTHSWSSRGGEGNCASKCFFLPWCNWRHIRNSYYDAEHKLIRTFWDDLERMERRRAKRAGASAWIGGDEGMWVETLPTTDFEFKDFDGEEIIVKTRITERMWRLGTGWCAWLGYIAKPKIERYLDLRFMKETGRRKGSWKGGTMGHAITMAPGEASESAFRRYCETHNMTFVAKIEPPPRDDPFASAQMAKSA